MTEQTHRRTTSSRVVAELRELIAALDRRVPHIERSGESQIVNDAAALRRRAVTRIRRLLFESEHHRYDPELVEAIMTDDGGPTPDSGSEVRS